MTHLLSSSRDTHGSDLFTVYLSWKAEPYFPVALKRLYTFVEDNNMNILSKSMSAVFSGVLLGAAATLPVLPGTAFAEGEGGVEVGILTCKKIPDTHEYYVVHSTVGVDCIFSHPEGEEHYSGR